VRSPAEIEADGYEARVEMLHRRISDLEIALLGVLRGPYYGASAMAVTFGCVVLGHPAIEDKEPESKCFCGTRKP
jgi:hypothetical protein